MFSSYQITNIISKVLLNNQQNKPLINDIKLVQYARTLSTCLIEKEKTEAVSFLGGN